MQVVFKEDERKGRPVLPDQEAFLRALPTSFPRQVEGNANDRVRIWMRAGELKSVREIAANHGYILA